MSNMPSGNQCKKLSETLTDGLLSALREALAEDGTTADIQDAVDASVKEFLEELRTEATARKAAAPASPAIDLNTAIKQTVAQAIRESVAATVRFAVSEAVAGAVADAVNDTLGEAIDASLQETIRELCNAHAKS